MAREDTRSKRQQLDDDDDDEDTAPVKGRGRGRDDDDDEPKARTRASASDDSEVSFDDEDAIETGLFASGPATIVESVIDRFKFGSSGDFPAWILTFERDGEKYEQPYSIGNGWDIDRKGRLIAKNGQKGLAKSCNAIRHLVKPFKQACADAKIEPLHLTPSTMGQLVGAEVEVERVAQEDRSFNDDRKRGSRADRERGSGEKKERTILEIREIVSAPWVDGGKKKAKAADKADTKSRKEEPEDDEDEDEPKTKSSKAPAKPSDAELEEEAIEAIVAVTEDGPVKMGEPLEEALEAHFKGRKGMGAVVDLASSKKFLQTEQGWSFDGKTVDAPKKRAKK